MYAYRVGVSRWRCRAVIVRVQDGETPLLLAASRGHVDVYDALVEKGAREDAIDIVRAVRTCGCESRGHAWQAGESCLSHAAMNGHLTTVVRILEKTAACDRTATGFVS